MKKKEKKVTLTWKRDYGDGMDTDDSVLWINGNPSNIIISGVDGGCLYLYINEKEMAIGETRKELKLMLEEDFKELLEKEIKSLTDLD